MIELAVTLRCLWCGQLIAWIADDGCWHSVGALCCHGAIRR